MLSEMHQEPSQSRAPTLERDEADEAADAAELLADALRILTANSFRLVQARWVACRLRELDHALVNLRPYLMALLPSPSPGEQ